MDKKKIKEKRVKDEMNSRKEFKMMLMMREECAMAQKDKTCTTMNKYLGEVDCLAYGENLTGFAIKKYPTSLLPIHFFVPCLMLFPPLPLHTN